MAAPYLYIKMRIAISIRSDLLNFCLVCEAMQQSVNSLIYYKYLLFVSAPSPSLNSFFLDYLSCLYHCLLLLFLSKTVPFAPNINRVFYYQWGYI